MSTEVMIFHEHVCSAALEKVVLGFWLRGRINLTASHVQKT